MKFIKESIPYLIIILVVLTIRTFIVTPIIVDGESMAPTLDGGELMILKKYDTSYERFDIVVVNKSVEGDNLIKRVIGLPGENIEYRNNTLYIDGQEVETKYNFDTDDFTLTSICNCDKIPEDKYLVLGDNRKVSADSRIIGLIDKKDIEGSAHISILPIKKVK